MRTRNARSSSGFARAASNALAVRSSGARAEEGAATFWASACDGKKSIATKNVQRTLMTRRARRAHIASTVPFEALALPCGLDSTISTCTYSHLARCNLQLTLLSQSVQVDRIRFLLRDECPQCKVAT